MKLRTRNLTAVAAVIQVAEQGSFTAAARTLGLSSSATSKAIARLEEELGVKLFHRTTRSVSLTPEGERYVEGVKPLLLEMDAITAEVTDNPSQPRGLLRVSAPAAYARSMLTPRLAEFSQRYPDINLDLLLEDRDVDLAAEQVDVAIRTGPLPDNVNLVARRLFTEPMITCASPDYLTQHGEPQTPDDLEQHNCIRFRNTRTGRPRSWFFKDGEQRQVAGMLTIDDAEAVGRAAIAGAGIAQIPGYMAKAGLETGALQEVLRSYRPPEVVFSALYLDRRFVSPRIRVFIDFLLEY